MLSAVTLAQRSSGHESAASGGEGTRSMPVTTGPTSGAQIDDETEDAAEEHLARYRCERVADPEKERHEDYVPHHLAPEVLWRAVDPRKDEPGQD